MSYQKFLEQKRIEDVPTGLPEIPLLNPMLFDFQKDITAWALKRGRACIFADCGMGKTPMQLEWARHIPGRVLIVAPLAVASQTIQEAEKFGIDNIEYLPEGELIDGNGITNYERLEKFDPSNYTGIVLDESSILKSYTGKIRNDIIERFGRIPYRLAATATPAPNDFMELGNHAEFVGAMSRTEMLSMFFVHDGGETQKWRLKGHAETEFWRWVASWAVMIRKPSDLGYEDGKFTLPALNIDQIDVETDAVEDGFLFPVEAQTLQERQQARRATIEDRTAVAAALIVDSLRLNVQNFQHDERTEVEVQPRILSEEQGEGEEAQAGLVLPESGQDQQRRKKGVFETVLPRKQREVGKVGRTVREEKRSAQREVSNRSNVSERSQGQGPGLAGEQPAEKKGAANISVWTDDGSIRGDVGVAELRMCDMRVQRHGEQEDVSGDRPQSCNGGSSGHTLRELQPHDRQGSRQSRSSKNGSKVSRKDQWIVWCNYNAEQDTMERLLNNCGISVSSVHGSLSFDEKIIRIKKWLNGETDVFLSKPSVAGYGLNLQQSHNMAFVGLSDSYEQYYQAVRRVWRFGQEQPVNVKIIVSELEGAVVKNIERKERDAAKMAEEMVKHMHEINQENIKGTQRTSSAYVEDVAKGDGWEVRLQDTVEMHRSLESDSVDYMIFSPPFSSLYTYSASDRDMGNSKNDQEFYEHYKFLVQEQFRTLRPGRLLSFHCMNLPTSKAHNGFIGIKDFRGDMIRLYQDAGFIFHSEVVIWKDPVTAMQRTKALGLLHKQIVKDSAMSRQGIPDYLVTMRKPGENPKPIAGEFDHYAGENEPHGGRYSIDVWQQYASPVWFDINPSNTLQKTSARAEKDERHIAPLQLEVIHRALQLWSLPGDLVVSPFAGIGSEGYEAIKMDRRFLGAELKPSYWQQAVLNLKEAQRLRDENTLFNMGPEDIEA